VNILPELRRIKGVAQARNLGSRTYAMRIWLNPDRMRAYNVATEEIMKAIADQSIIGSPGKIGQSSGIQAQSLEYLLIYKGRFAKPEEYENIVIRANFNGEILRLKDVAKVELGSEFQDIYSSIDGHPSASIMIKQTFDSNANEVIKKVKTKMAQEHLSPYYAVQKVLDEISGAVIAITLLMISVFVPIAFMEGPVGVLLKQFSVTMSSSIALSGVIALTLTPVLSAMILKSHDHNLTNKRKFIAMNIRKFNVGFKK